MKWKPLMAVLIGLLMVGVVKVLWQLLDISVLGVEVGMNDIFLFFGAMAAVTPWTVLLVGIVVHVNKIKYPYSSALSTSVAFLLGEYLEHLSDIFYWVTNFWLGGLLQEINYHVDWHKIVDSSVVIRGICDWDTEGGFSKIQRNSEGYQ
ncbi:hypothetical protein [Thermococcus piezophilus]|uniref:Uncharacterized protein n=1 Tax=Thermococcus piezophilus TaxID=1712654 RepID=A0A172WG37_9EURY|nr:hypothetical protein [Thermococcus piezophilus]ANF22397.1 hypothetical protein A7C91_03830 [Thermococcus piezophilus]